MCTNSHSLRSKRFQSCYCAKVRAEAKKTPPPPPSLIFFLLLPQLSRRTSRGNACYVGYNSQGLGWQSTIWPNRVCVASPADILWPASRVPNNVCGGG